LLVNLKKVGHCGANNLPADPAGVSIGAIRGKPLNVWMDDVPRLSQRMAEPFDITLQPTGFMRHVD